MAEPAHTNPHDGLDARAITGDDGKVIGYAVNIPEGGPQRYRTPFDLETPQRNADKAAEAAPESLGLPTAEESAARAIDLAESAEDIGKRLYKL